MAKNTTAQATAAVNYYLRPGKDIADPTTGEFELNGIQAIMHVNASGDIAVYKRTRTAITSRSKPIAKGKWIRSNSTEAKQPNIRGHITTAKNTTFRLVGWLHGEPGDQFYTFSYDQQQRHGNLFFV